MARELRITTPDSAVRVVKLAGDRLTLGRSSATDLCYPEDSGLSRQHLAFEREGADWRLRDLGSKNGTVVNSVRITGAVKLSPGDQLAAGHLLIEFAEAGSPLETVVFVNGAEQESPTSSTITTHLEGLLEPGAAQDRPGLQGPAQMQALIRAGRELAGHRPLAELFEVILDLAMEAVNASRGVLMTLEGGELAVRAARGEGFRISTAVRDRVIGERTSILVRDAQLEQAFRERLSIVEQRVRGMIAVPLQTAERAIGLIYVDSPGIVRDFGQEDLNLLTVMANVAAIRIEHARLAEIEQAERMLARELQQAADIQRRLLPSEVPAVAGIDLAGYNAPCRTVGGDYYDFFTYPDGRLVMLVGDVAGKGMPAALMMSSLQARVRALSEDALPVGEFVARLNRRTCSSCPNNRFITFFICVLDPATGEFSYCNAGHNPPLLVRAGGAAERLTGGGTFLGVFPAMRYEEMRGVIRPGDMLVMFSDGITEATPAGPEEEFGEERLAEFLAARTGLKAVELIAEVNQALAGWTHGAPPADDVTIVVARRLAGAQAARPR